MGSLITLSLMSFLSVLHGCDGVCTVISRPHAAFFAGNTEVTAGHQVQRDTNLRIICNEPGFRKLQGRRIIRCLQSDTFDSEIGFCQADAQGCEINIRQHGTFVVNGRIQQPGHLVPIGEHLELECSQEGDTRLIGHSKVICMENAEFDTTIGICEQTTATTTSGVTTKAKTSRYDTKYHRLGECGEPPRIANGVIKGGPNYNRSLWSMLPVKCDVGYKNRGWPRIICSPFGWTWSGACLSAGAVKATTTVAKLRKPMLRALASNMPGYSWTTTSDQVAAGYIAGNTGHSLSNRGSRNTSLLLIICCVLSLVLYRR